MFVWPNRASVLLNRVSVSSKRRPTLGKKDICLHQTEPIFEQNRASVYVWFYYSYSLCSYVSTLKWIPTLIQCTRRVHWYITVVRWIGRVHWFWCIIHKDEWSLNKIWASTRKWVSPLWQNWQNWLWFLWTFFEQ